MSPPPGEIKTFAVVMAICTGFALALNCVAIAGPWWQSSSVLHTVHMTLWKIEVDISGVVTSVEWEAFCGKEYANDNAWCTNITTARATTILTAIFSLFTTLSLLIGLGSKGWIKVGCANLLLAYIFSGIAIGVGTWYPQNSKLDSPGYGFIMLVVGSSFIWISILVALFGICCKCCKGCSGWESFENGSQWGSYRPEPKKPMPPPMQRPVVAMPPPVPMPQPIVQMPMPVAVGQKQADFGIAPAGAGPGMTPNPMSPQMPPPARPGDFGVAPPSGLMNNGMAQQQGRQSYGQMPPPAAPQPMPQPGRSSGHDFGIDRE